MALSSTTTRLYDEDTQSIVSVKTPIPQIGNGPADPIENGSLEHIKNQKGFTHPDLHRKIDPADPQHLSEAELAEKSPHELEPRSYSVGIFNNNSYRTTHKIVHTEEEFIRPQGESAMAPDWEQHTGTESEYTSDGTTAIWEQYPKEANPVSRGTPDEIP